MKLLLCWSCSDVRKFGSSEKYKAVCNCGKTSAWYLDDGHCGVLKGDSCDAIGMGNGSITKAGLNIRNHSGEKGPEIITWMFPKDYFRIGRVE